MAREKHTAWLICCPATLHTPPLDMSVMRHIPSTKSACGFWFLVIQSKQMTRVRDYPVTGQPPGQMSQHLLSFLLVKPPGKGFTFSFLILCLPSNIVFCCLHQIVWPRGMCLRRWLKLNQLLTEKGIKGPMSYIRSVPEELGKLEPHLWSVLEGMDRPAL